jgi:membrane AbrB-like protein
MTSTSRWRDGPLGRQREVAVALIGTLVSGAVVGLVAERLKIPGGLILGSMVGAAAFSVWRDVTVTTPSWLKTSAFIVVGCSVGVLVTRDFLTEIRSVAAGALLAGVLIIVAGIGIALLLRALGMAPPSDALATSPGALTVMSAAALEQGKGAVEVAAFHVVRIILVMMSLPLLRLLLPER